MTAGHGLYVHIPWCRIRCPYCHFAVSPDRSGVGAPPPFDAFVDAVLREHAARAADFPGPAATVFLGGGTPSRLPPDPLTRLLAGLPRDGDAEVSMEMNPEDVAEALAPALDAGVNRVSLGIQTLQPHLARRIGRAHSQPHARAALARVAASAARSWSADLIFALPEQTLPELNADLDALLDHAPPHVALYGLTIEPETPFHRAVAGGRLSAPTDEAWRAQYDRIVARLEDAGLHRYEVSNFARPGHRSAHNLGYWTGRPYVGLGPSAHGLCPDGTRYVNHAAVEAWMAAPDPTAQREPPDPHRQAEDALIAGMRWVDGVDLAALATATGFAPADAVVDGLVRGGLIARRGPRVHLAGDGWPLADGVVTRLVRALQPVSPTGDAGLGQRVT